MLRKLLLIAVLVLTVLAAFFITRVGMPQVLPAETILSESVMTMSSHEQLPFRLRVHVSTSFGSGSIDVSGVFDRSLPLIIGTGALSWASHQNGSLTSQLSLQTNADGAIGFRLTSSTGDLANFLNRKITGGLDNHWWGWSGPNALRAHRASDVTPDIVEDVLEQLMSMRSSTSITRDEQGLFFQNIVLEPQPDTDLSQELSSSDTSLRGHLTYSFFEHRLTAFHWTMSSTVPEPITTSLTVELLPVSKKVQYVTQPLPQKLFLPRSLLETIFENEQVSLR